MDYYLEFDNTNLTQEQKNMIKAMISKVLFDNSVTHEGITVINTATVAQITIKNAIPDPTPFITKANIVAVYQAWRDAQDIADAEAQAIELTKQQEKISNDMGTITLETVDNIIDNLQNVGELKVFLKKLVRYMIATNVLRS